MRLRRDRLMIVLRPSATRHKFWLCTGFATGRPPEHPPGRPLRSRIQAMGKKADTDYKKYKAPDGAILRAEGHSRRCRQFESVAAQRHMNPTAVLCVGADLIKAARCEIRPQPIRV